MPMKARRKLDFIFHKMLVNRLKRLWSHKDLVSVIILSYLLSLVIIVIATQKDNFLPRKFDYQLGDIAREDIKIDRDIEYLDQDATAHKKEARLKLVPAVYVLNEDVARESLVALNKMQKIVLQAAYGESQIDTLLVQLQYEFPKLIGKIRKEELFLLYSHKKRYEIFQRAYALLEEVMYEGVFPRNIKPDLRTGDSSANEVELWRNKGSTVIPIYALLTSDTLDDWLYRKSQQFNLMEIEKRLVNMLVRTFTEANCFFDEAKTEDAKKKALRDVEDEMVRLRKGQTIVGHGYPITEAAIKIFRVYGETTTAVNIFGIIGSAFFLLILYLVFFFALSSRFFENHLTKNEIYFLLVSCLVYLFIMAFTAQAPWGIETLPSWLPTSVLIPTSAFVILVAMLVSDKIGVLFSLIFAFLALLVTKVDTQSNAFLMDSQSHALLFAFISGVAGCAVVQGVEKRLDLIRAGIFLSVCNFVIIFILGLLKINKPVDFFLAALYGSLNGFFSGILSLGFMPMLEHILNAPTRFRLMELSDLNAPILKKMLSLAPGTYTHSISVANLAESTCTQIGANALLARVGAYYHDIGKIEQAKYFIENQRDYNRHDDLKPSLSAAVIKSHLKIGVEKARELGLPKKVVDIIAQHHGKGIIAYFYHRALHNNDLEEELNREKISSDDFCYAGERPESKEAAVVMLADHVEAASRTIKKPTIAKLEKLVWMIIMDKFKADELSKSNLTFKDLEIIKQSFVHVLTGYFHSRIEYPRIKEKDKKERKELIS